MINMASEKRQSFKPKILFRETLAERDAKVFVVEIDGRERILKVENSAIIGIKNPCEIDVPVKYRHPSIVSVEMTIPRGFGKRIDGFSFIMPRYETDLHHLKAHKSFPDWNERLLIVYKFFYALHLLHEKGVIHLDIKPGNIAYHQGEPIYIDFGMAKYLDATGIFRDTNRFGTMNHMAPELYYETEYSRPIDVWAVAVTAIYVLSGESFLPDKVKKNAQKMGSEKALYIKKYHDSFFLDDDRRNARITKILESSYIPQDEKPGLQKLFEGMLQYQQQNRWTMAKVIQDGLWSRFAEKPPPLTLTTSIRRYPDIEAMSDIEINKIRQDLSRILWIYLKIKNRVEVTTRQLFLSLDIYYRSLYLLLNMGDDIEKYRAYFIFGCVFLGYISFTTYRPRKIERIVRTALPVRDDELMKKIVDSIISKGLLGFINDNKIYDLLPKGAAVQKDCLRKIVFIPKVYVKITKNYNTVPKKDLPVAKLGFQ